MNAYLSIAVLVVAVLGLISGAASTGLPNEASLKTDPATYFEKHLAYQEQHLAKETHQLVHTLSHGLYMACGNNMEYEKFVKKMDDLDSPIKRCIEDQFEKGDRVVFETLMHVDPKFNAQRNYQKFYYKLTGKSFRRINNLLIDAKAECKKYENALVVLFEKAKKFLKPGDEVLSRGWFNRPLLAVKSCQAFYQHKFSDNLIRRMNDRAKSLHDAEKIETAALRKELGYAEIDDDADEEPITEEPIDDEPNTEESITGEPSEAKNA